ncbi:MAG: hypothetical protein L0287_36370 [Anaerolineae bacterium]|nr:hypothetical protein [Anaerolineae bacterium]MCI0607974.1 hypothetical protein [Anaerolineae bacterium]
MAKPNYFQSQKESLKEQERILLKLKPLQKRIESQEIEQKKIENAITRLSKPRPTENILSDFANANINARIRRRFAQADANVLDTVIDKIGLTVGDVINNFNKDLPGNIQLWNDRGRWMNCWLRDWSTAVFVHTKITSPVIRQKALYIVRFSALVTGVLGKEDTRSLGRYISRSISW